MKVSARQLREALKKLPDPRSYDKPIINVRVDKVIVVFVKREYHAPPRAVWYDWALEVI